MVPAPKPKARAEQLTAVSPRERRWVLLRAIAGVALLDAALLVTYAIIPIDDAAGAAPILMFAVMLVVFAIVVMWQIRAIVNARFPGVRAAAATAFAIPVYIVLCALTFLAIDQADAAAFTEPLSRADSLYFTVTVFATVGFGDISAVSTPARLAVTAVMIMNLLVLGLIVKVLMGAAQVRLTSSATAAASDEVASGQG